MMTIDNNNVKRVIDSWANPGNNFSRNTLDSATAGGMAFLQAELEKRDPKVREPLTSVTYPRDIVIKSGGGYVDFTSVFNIDYGTTGPNSLGIMGGQTNAIPTMQADIEKDIYRVYTWSNILKTPYVDMQKLQGIGRSLDDILDRGIRLNYNKSIDQIVYNGWGSDSGLINNSGISTGFAAEGAGHGTGWIPVSSTSYVGKTPDEMVADINDLMVATWAASEYDITGMCNHILIPPAQFAYISSQKISNAGNVSILTYLLENNIGKTQGIDLQIYPSRWCIGAGETAGSPAVATDRMVGYVNDEDRVYMDVTVPINRAMTQPSVEQAAYITLYIAQMGVVKFLYLEPVAYVDGI